MTDPGTHVDATELDELSSVVFDIAAGIRDAAERASAIHYDVGTFGVLGVLATGSCRDVRDGIAAALRALHLNVHADATAVSDTAADVRDNEQLQTNRFREDDHG